MRTAFDVIFYPFIYYQYTINEFVIMKKIYFMWVVFAYILISCSGNTAEIGRASCRERVYVLV